MGLQLSGGFLGEYWKLTTPNLFAPNSVTLVLYKSKQDCLDGGREVTRLSVSLPGDGLTKSAIIAAGNETPARNLFKLAYDLVKAPAPDENNVETNPFATAVDV